MDQVQLIERCRTGDLNSFEELYKLYRQKALGTAFLIGRSRSIAEDIVQEAFIICFYKIRQLKDPEFFNVWFYKIIVRVGWRISKKFKNHISFEETVIDRDNDSTNLFDNTNNDKSENRLLVREAIRKLSLPYKTVVILYYYNDLKINEIASVLDCFQGTVKSRLSKARELLKKELGKSSENEYSFKFEAEGM